MKNKHIYFQKVKSIIQNLTKERNIFELELKGISSALRKISNEYNKINLGVEYKRVGKKKIVITKHKTIDIQDEFKIYDECLNECPHLKEKIISTLLTIKNHDYLKAGLDRSVLNKEIKRRDDDNRILTDDRNYFAEQSEHNKKWHDEINEVHKLTDRGMTQPKAIRMLIDKKATKRIRLELDKGKTKEKLTQNIKRALSR